MCHGLTDAASVWTHEVNVLTIDGKPDHAGRQFTAAGFLASLDVKVAALLKKLTNS